MVAIVTKIRLEFDRKLMPKATAAELNKFGDKITADAGKHVAQTVASIYRKMLLPKSKGGTQNIGVTGAAASNFYLEYVKGKWAGQSTWNVVEGDNTVANELIRTGIPRHVKQPISNIRMWMARKGISPVYQEQPNVVDIKPRIQIISAKYKSGKTSTYSRARQGQKQRLDNVLYKIRSALWARGTERPEESTPNTNTMGANWYPKFPAGQGRFDYVVYAFSRPTYKNAIEMASADASSEAQDTILNYLGSGRKKSLRMKTSDVWSGGYKTDWPVKK